jgi:hypothetical protein
MKPWPLVVVVGGLLATAGCRTDPAIPILERQLRLQEDEIYRLRAALDQTQDCGPVCSDREVGPSGSRSRGEAEPNGSRRRHGPAPSGMAPPAVEVPSEPSGQLPDVLKSPAGSRPSGVPEVPENLRGPSPPLGPQPNRPPKPSTDRSFSPQQGDDDGPMLEPEVGGVTARPGKFTLASLAASGVPITPSGDSRRVAAIVLNRTLTGGIGVQGASGDQGLLVVVEPRDRAGRVVDAPAEISVVVLDRALEGDAARVARWDFTAAETAAMFRRTGAAAAIHLTTAWPGDPPVHRQLHLFVRYVTADGRKLQTDMPIEVALSGDRTTQWNRSDRPPERSPAAESVEQPLASRVPGPSPQMAPRRDDGRPRRPVWSPERR